MVTVRVSARRKDGKYLARYTFASTGKTVGEIMTREKLDATLIKNPDYTVQGYARPIVVPPHAEVSARAATDAHAHMMHHPFEALHVYYVPTLLDASTGRVAVPGKLFAATVEGAATVPGAVLAWPERVPGDRTCAGLIAWFADRSGRVPYRGSNTPSAVEGDA